jgi:hypothetical protein
MPRLNRFASRNLTRFNLHLRSRRSIIVDLRFAARYISHATTLLWMRAVGLVGQNFVNSGGDGPPQVRPLRSRIQHS